MYIIFLDTETTGLEENDEVLSLSIIDGDGGILFDHRIKPTHRRTWAKAERIHGISPKDVSNEKKIGYYKEEIQGILDGAEIVVGYNVQYDLAMLSHGGIKCDPGKAFDVMEPFARIYGEWVEWRGSYKWQKLVTCAEHYGYDWGAAKAHGSLADAMATRHCFIRMFAKRDIILTGEYKSLQLRIKEYIAEQVPGWDSKSADIECLRKEVARKEEAIAAKEERRAKHREYMMEEMERSDREFAGQIEALRAELAKLRDKYERAVSGGG